MKSEIRKHYFLDKYVIFTPHRAKRPKGTIAKAVIIPEKTCPFCPDNIEKDLIIKGYPNLKKWQYLVLKNKYPVVTLDNEKAYGQHEVVIETRDHLKQLSQFSLEELIGLLNVYKDRVEKLSKIKNIEYVLVFKNEGPKAGATIIHAHSQIFASKILPPDVVEEQASAKKYEAEKGNCPYCDILKKEEKGPRKIFANKEVVAFCPYASFYHYEAWILPRRHVDNITCLTKKETFSFAEALKKILVKLFILNLEYNFFLHQIVNDPDQHFYLKIQPRESIWAGIELGSGLVVNSLLPEKAAKFYRK
jgi:UDPglucose--hexose-1-phosphate uridylyltransferase